ncbi:MAG: glycosyltransferase family 4 protein, partial [Acidimicrobiaceae bacterium]|nr:glycosyltransferase family 4 protein [Acidimicrobiaceae bacterium]
ATNLGPVMDEAVLRAKRQMRIGVDPDYDLLYENFDVLHYLLQCPDLLDEPEVDLIEHFLKYGRTQRLSPHPDFSMIEYVDRYPIKTAAGKIRNPFLFWLKYGRAAGDIADPAPGILRMAAVLGMAPEQLADLLGERRRDLQQRFRTGRLGEVFARAAEIEPLIGATWTEIARPHLIPLSRRTVVDEIYAIYQAQEAAGFRRARVVFVINRARWGSGRRIEGHIAHALSAHVEPDEIVVIYTDESTEEPPGRYPDGVRRIDFANVTRGMPKDIAQHALVMVLRSFRADSIVNINSRMLYEAMRSYGRALAATERLFLCFLCNEQTGMGTWVGWSLRYFYRLFDHVAGVITDSEHLANDLIEAYQVPAKDRERLHVFRAPVDASLPVVSESPASPGRRPQVFWAGRWDRQKRIGLVLEVARLMPDVDFRMWGESVLTGSHILETPGNVRLEGAYAHLSEVPLAEADVWLYTSGWDGVPSQLLEVAMTGIPIVGSLVGGVGEVLSEEDAWPVAHNEDAEAYVAAIRAALADPGDARRRALALRERMLRERTEKAFATQAVGLLLDDDSLEQSG